MSLQVEKLEKNMAKLTIEVSAEELEKAIETAYQKNKNKMSVPGFRKGKVPRKMIEKMYGTGVFYEEAANELIPTAYEKALEESGITIDKDLVFFKDLRVKSGYKAIETFLANNKKFDGVVCSSDEIAIGVINALREKGINVPGDVSVIGFNDNAVASCFYPKITTVRQPSYDMGSVAMRMLIKILNNKPLEQDQYVLDYSLIQRESCK